MSVDLKVMELSDKKCDDNTRVLFDDFFTLTTKMGYYDPWFALLEYPHVHVPESCYSEGFCWDTYVFDKTVLQQFIDDTAFKLFTEQLVQLLSQIQGDIVGLQLF